MSATSTDSPSDRAAVSPAASPSTSGPTSGSTRGSASGSGATSNLGLEINGEARSFEASDFPGSVAELLEGLGLGAKRVAVAVNRNVVVRSRYAEFELCAGDRIEILEAVGGG